MSTVEDLLRVVPVVSPANPATDMEPEYVETPERSRPRPGTGRTARRRARRIEQGSKPRPGPSTRKVENGNSAVRDTKIIDSPGRFNERA